MSQISLREAKDLLSKLLEEKIRLTAMFVSVSGARLFMPGFVDGLTEINGLALSVSGPPIDVNRGFMNVRPFDRTCEFSYGEKRELPEEMRPISVDRDNESALMMRFPDFGETVVLFFTL